MMKGGEEFGLRGAVGFKREAVGGHFLSATARHNGIGMSSGVALAGFLFHG